MLETVIVIRNVFYRCFFISLGFFLFSIIFYLLFNDFAVSMNANIFAIEETEVYLVVYNFFGWMKLIILNLFLIPALALHWTANRLAKGQS